MPAGSSPDDLDTARIARVHAALAGSCWADAAGREAADLIAERFPGARERMNRAREFHSRAARRAVTCSARSLLFGASGYPARPAVHEAALAAVPSARACYAEADPVVTEIRDAIHGDAGRITACNASVRDPAALFSRPEVKDLPRPVHFQVQLAMHYWPPRQARGLIGAYGRLLDAGSVLLLTWMVPADTAAGSALTEFLGGLLGTGIYRHPSRAVTRWLEESGFTVLSPGPRDVRNWGRGWGHFAAGERAVDGIMGVIARAR